MAYFVLFASIFNVGLKMRLLQIICCLWQQILAIWVWDVVICHEKDDDGDADDDVYDCVTNGGVRRR